MNEVEKKAEYQKQWHIKNPEYSKQYREKNWENIKKRMDIYCNEHKEQYRESSRRYQKRHREYMNEIHRKYIKTEKGKAVCQRGMSKRRAIGKLLINTLTAKEWSDILKKYKFRCAYCGKEFTLFNRETKDHVIPISKGGDNTKENVVPACRSCNSKKYNKTINRE